MDVSRITVSKHALQRLFQRQIAIEDVALALEDQVEVMSYPDDQPWPSRLVRGYVHSRPIHMVIADNPNDGKVILITVYEPDPQEWNEDFTRRRTS